VQPRCGEALLSGAGLRVTAAAAEPKSPRACRAAGSGSEYEALAWMLAATCLQYSLQSKGQSILLTAALDPRLRVAPWVAAPRSAR
jgi:hypothetical protein